MVIDRIKSNYGFKLCDEQALMKLGPIMEKHEDDFAGAFYAKAMQFKNAEKYLKSEEIVEKHKEAIKNWFLMLFSGSYEDDYLSYLEGIGYTHVKVGLPSHYVNVSITFVREFCTNIIMSEISVPQEKEDMLRALGKLLDINLDILTSSYIQEEKNIFFVSKKAESKLINFAMRFSHGLNLILVVGLVLLGLMVLGLFGYDLTHFFRGGDLERGLLATLGSLLMLWVVIELVDTEVEHLRGAKFSVKVFVGVAMVAVIRKILVTSLKTEAVEAQYSLIAALAVLGFLWWLISKTEKE